jgi:hypothetical protein
MSEDKSIKLRWIECDEQMVTQSLLISKEDCNALKQRLLDRMNIVKLDTESYSDAWLRTMCAENGYEFIKPVCREMADAVTENAGAFRFFFFLT